MAAVYIGARGRKESKEWPGVVIFTHVGFFRQEVSVRRFPESYAEQGSSRAVKSSEPVSSSKATASESRM